MSKGRRVGSKDPYSNNACIITQDWQGWQHTGNIYSQWITSINRFTFRETNQIYVRLGNPTTDLEVNLTEREKKKVLLAPAIDEDAYEYPGPKCSIFFATITKYERWTYGQLVTLSIMLVFNQLDYFGMCYMPPASINQILSISSNLKTNKIFFGN